MQLSDRQRSIVQLIATLGPDYDEIAEELDLSPSTVRDTVTRMCFRFQCRPAQLPRVTGLESETREA